MKRLTIALRLALETIIPLPEEDKFDIEREIPKNHYPKDTPVYINLLTLVRSVVKENIDASDTSVLVYTALAEKRAIDDIFETHRLPKPVYYRIDYRKTNKRYNLVEYIREHKNPKSKVAIEVETASKVFLEIIKEDDSIVILEKEKLPKTSILLTHIPMDILIVSKKTEPVLLMRHTGKLVPFYNLYERLSRIGKDILPLMPYNWTTLKIFGDSIIKPNDIRLRRAVSDIAIKRKWKATTSEVLIRNNIQADIRKLPSFTKYKQDVQESLIKSINKL